MLFAFRKGLVLSSSVLFFFPLSWGIESGKDKSTLNSDSSYVTLPSPPSQPGSNAYVPLVCTGLPANQTPVFHKPSTTEVLSHRGQAPVPFWHFVPLFFLFVYIFGWNDLDFNSFCLIFSRDKLSDYIFLWYCQNFTAMTCWYISWVWLLNIKIF